MGSSALQTLRPKQPKRLAKTLPAGINPVRVDWQQNGALAVIQFSDGMASPGSCIRCTKPPCMEYAASELELDLFRDFPADRNESVCPTGAITWLMDNDSPIIDSDTCISCGLCVSRCPTRAIYLDDSGAHINDAPNHHFQVRNFPVTRELTEAIAMVFEEVEEQGIYRAESDTVLSAFLGRFVEVAKSQSAQFPNHLARNLLIACGIGAAMRRRGDTNIRMDMVLGPPGVESGTSEVELGGALDAPRNILDNVAVLVARYEMDKDRIVPLIVSLSLPNQRSEYWQVIKDIRDVLGVKINSITVGALVLLVWNRAKIEIRSGEELYADADRPSLRPQIAAILGRKVKLTIANLGFLESTK